MTIHNYFQKREKIENGRLYKTLNGMPKGGNLHVHTAAAFPAEAYIELTYDDRTYYNQSTSTFKIIPES